MSPLRGMLKAAATSEGGEGTQRHPGTREVPNEPNLDVMKEGRGVTERTRRVAPVRRVPGRGESMVDVPLSRTINPREDQVRPLKTRGTLRSI